MSYHCWSQRADYWILCFTYLGEICWKLLQKSWFWFFFGWRLCVLRTCVCVLARVSSSRHSRAWWLSPISLSLPFWPFSPIHGRGTSLEAAGCCCCWLDSFVFNCFFLFNFIFFDYFISNFRVTVKRQANEGLEKTLYYFCYSRFFSVLNLYSSALPRSIFLSRGS